MHNPENPYLTPESNPEAEVVHPAGVGSSIYGPFRDARGIAKANMVLLSLCGLSSLLYAVANVLLYSALSVPEAELNYEQIESLAGLMQMTAILMVVGYIATIVVFCIWTNRVMKNTWAIRSHSALMTPGWAVGWYFIPILSFWKPLAAVQQMRDVAFGGQRGLNLTPWWLTWVVSSILGRISAKLPTDTIEELQASTFFDFITAPVDIICAIFAVLMVKKLTNRQHQVAVGDTQAGGSLIA